VFNLEGGCYSKVSDLSEAAEPEIWAAAHHFGTVLENVVADPHGNLDFADRTYTENTRACYPVDFIPNAELSGRGAIPKNIFMLTADAFGVMPALARLTPPQAMYHFLSGYTARVAGTEKGMGAEPQATFSPCFGAPFLPRHPAVYGQLLEALIARHGISCWLLNTGWTGGAYGVGKRMSIIHTRALLRAALSGELDRASFRTDPFFGLHVPEKVANVPATLLDPRAGWADPAAYDAAARALAKRFEANFAQFADKVGEDVKSAAIRSVA
jgi:phosphoenolpyruvate carboxykinase (ATP)